MVNAANVTSAVVSFVSLALLAIAVATNSWVRFEYPRDSSGETESINPLVSNTDLDGLRLQYDLDYFGLWVGCHREDTYNAISCGFINFSCNSTICWTRDRSERTCLANRVDSIVNNCIAYTTTRAFTILGTIFLIFGAALFLVSTCVTSRPLVWWGTVLNGLAAIFTMIAFVVFYVFVFQQGNLNVVANMGWSFIMLIVSWPLAVIATMFGVLAALSTPTKLFDYEESE